VLPQVRKRGWLAGTVSFTWPTVALVSSFSNITRMVRAAPLDEAEYLAAEHATVVYEPRRSLDLDQHLAAKGVQRRFAVMVPTFSALPAFVRGTPLLATVPALLARHTLLGLASCPAPVTCPSMPMYMIWHTRYQQDASHRWLRAQLEAVVAPALAEVTPKS